MAGTTDKYVDISREPFWLFIMLLTSTIVLLTVLIIALVKYKHASKSLIASRTRFHQRAVLIHENYLTLPNFINDVEEWKKRYEKAKIDFEYTLSILAPSDGSSSQRTASARQRVCAALKSQAERRFADLQHGHHFCVDEWSDWLTKFLQDNPKEKLAEMEHRLIELGKLRGVGLDSRQKRRIRDEKQIRRMKRRQERGRNGGCKVGQESCNRETDKDSFSV